MLEKWQLDLRSWDTPVFLHFYQCWYRHSKRLLICVTSLFFFAGYKCRFEVFCFFFKIWYDIKKLKVRWPWGLSWRRCSPTRCRLRREDGWRVRGPVWASDWGTEEQMGWNVSENNEGWQSCDLLKGTQLIISKIIHTTVVICVPAFQ